MTGEKLVKLETPQERASRALGLLRWPIAVENERTGEREVDETALHGLEALASALISWNQLDLGRAPLDQVLAALSEDDSIVEKAARLIELVGRASYAGGLSSESLDEADQLREELREELDELVTRLAAEEDPADD